MQQNTPTKTISCHEIPIKRYWRQPYAAENLKLIGDFFSKRKQKILFIAPKASFQALYHTVNNVSDAILISFCIWLQFHYVKTMHCYELFEWMRVQSHLFHGSREKSLFRSTFDYLIWTSNQHTYIPKGNTKEITILWN